MPDLYKLARPLLFQMEPEQAHNTTIKMMKTGLMPACKAVSNPALEHTLWGLRFPNPIGLAAGFDKNAEVIGPVLGLGFGFAEAGTVTPKPQPGNPKPRVFRSPDHGAVINRMGFPGDGMHSFKANLEKFLARKPRPAGVVGINIGMNKDQTEPAKDYTTLIKMLGPMADYLTVNISSPNTPGLRNLQEPEALGELIEILRDTREKACGEAAPPLLVKLAPDLDEAQQEAIANTLIKAEIDGIILTNTTLARPETLPESFRSEKGGLSGQPLTDAATEVLKNFYKLTEGKIPLIGVGGVSSGEQAYAKIKAGASLVQLYTGLVFEGPFVAHYINQTLETLLKADGFTSIGEAIGKDT